MKKKFIFFDIDGTLTDDNPGGKVLPSTLSTLQKLKDQGHFVAIATGRAEFFAKPFKDTYHFDHMVSDGGNGLTIDNQLLYIEPLDFVIANEIIDECLEKDIPFAVAIDNTPRIYTNSPIHYDNQMEFELIEDLTMDFHQVKQIMKIFIACTRAQEVNIQSMHKLGYMRYHNAGCIVEPLDKYRGIVKMVELLDGNVSDIVVFGDGKNDISMISQAPIGIAMGNAIDEVKRVASFITKSNKDDGIEYACRYFGWID